MPLTPSRRRSLAAAGSFGVYLIPLVGPHAAWLVGEVLLRPRSSGKTPAWMAAEIGFALVLQALTCALLLWALRQTLRLAVFIVVIPVMWTAAQAMYLSVIPAHFLIEADTAPETQALTERCVVDRAGLLPVRVPIDLPLLGTDEWWLQYPDGRYGMLNARDCSVTMAAFPRPAVREGRADFILGLQFYVPGRGTIVERLEPPTGRRSWWLVRAPDAPMQPLVAPEHQELPPVLSNDGRMVVWQQTIPGSPAPVLTQLIVHTIEGQTPDLRIDLSGAGPGSYTVGAIDPAAHAVTLWKDETIVVVGFDGRLRLAYSTPATVRAQPGTYRIGADGAWLAWDAYKEEGPYRLEWMTDHGGGLTLPRGRSITDAAFDRARRVVAFSATTTLSIGRTEDLLAIVSADTGRDLFRRYLPRYSRTPTVFFTRGEFAYSDPAGTHVVTLP